MIPSTPETLATIRFGFGLSPLRPPQGPAALLAGLTGPDKVRDLHPMTGQAAAEALLGRLREANRARKTGGDSADAAYRRLRREVDQVSGEFARVSFQRGLDAEAPLRERLVLFWADHFTVQHVTILRRALAPAYLDEVIRPHLTGSFADLLKAVVTSPQMLHYLDQTSSIGPGSRIGQRRGRGLNENLARELLELHTLGVGSGYGQDDVRQLAELLTGLDYKIARGFSYRAGMAEPGAETVLGQSYGGRRRGGLDAILAALDDLAVHPDTAAHIARKLVVHFVSDTPDPAHVAAVAAAWRDGGGALPPVYAALLNHPAALAPLGPGSKAKPPFDLLVSSMTALGVTGSQVAAMPRKRWRRWVLRPLQVMGQYVGRPAGPDGWPEAAAAWIGPQGLAARIRWAMEVPARLVDPLPDPRAFVRTALGPVASAELTWAVSAAEDVPQGVGLVLASPEFNRR